MSPLPAPPTTSTTTDAGNNEDMQQIAFSKNSRICSWMLVPSCCYSSETSPSWWEQMQLQSPEKNREQRWWFRGWMKVREWSEIVAGPKWKTFIRRFNNNNNKNRNGYVKQGPLNYDPLSYALNFDDGNDGDDGDGYSYGVFSSRFASVPATAKSSMDLGKDATVIT